MKWLVKALFTLMVMMLLSMTIVSAQKTAEEYLQQGRDLAAEGAYEEAITAYNAALELNPHLAEAYYWRGRAYLAIGDDDAATADYEQAIIEYSAIIEENPNDADAYNGRGTVHRSLRDYEDAISDFTEAIGINPDVAEYYYNRGRAYASLGNNEQAIDDFSRSIELNETYVDAYYRRALVFTAIGDYDSAINDYTSVIDLEPENAQAYYNRGANYHAQSKYREAIADYDMSIELDRYFPDVYANLGAAYYDQGDLEQALSNLHEYVRLAGDSADPGMLHFVARVEAESEGLRFYTLQVENKRVTIGGLPYLIPSFSLAEYSSGEYQLGMDATRFYTAFFEWDSFVIFLQNSVSGNTMHQVAINVGHLDSFYVKYDIVYPENQSTIGTNGPFVTLVFQYGEEHKRASGWEIRVEQGEQTVTGTLSEDGTFDLENVGLLPIDITLTNPADSKTYEYRALPALRGAVKGLVSYFVVDITDPQYQTP